MSTLNSIIGDLQSLIFPARCLGCGKVLGGRTEWVCIECRAAMPLTHYHLDAENPMAVKIKGLQPQLVSVAAQFFFVGEGRWRRVIHQMKYHHQWNAAYKMGLWYGTDLSESPLYQGVDVVVPVPLHPFKRFRRGYNQSELLARGIAKSLGVSVDLSSLRRVKYNKSQVTRSRSERWENVDGIFSVERGDRLSGRHILLVDDVFTTGATILSCAETILKAVPSCRISIATLAVSRKEIIGNPI